MLRGLVALLMMCGVAAAQERSQEPNVLLDEMTNQYLVETGNLRVLLGNARAEVARLRKQLDELRTKKQ